MPQALKGLSFVGGGFFSDSRDTRTETKTDVSRTVDRFSDGDLFEYSNVSQPWSISSFDGDNYLDGDGANSGSGAIRSARPGNGGPDFEPQRGDEIRFTWTIGTGSDFNFYFGSPDYNRSGRYVLKFRGDTDTIRLESRFGSGSRLIDTDATINTGTTYATTILWRTDDVFELSHGELGGGQTKIATSSPDEATVPGSGRYGFYIYSDSSVGIDNITLTRTQVGSLFEDFEDGIGPNWFVNDLSPVSDRSYTGTQSGYTANDVIGSPQAAWTLDEAQRLQAMTFYVNETSSSTGEGFRFRNSNGDVELGAALDNPEWDVDGANGAREVFNRSDTYNEWVRVNITFDWVAGTAEIAFQSEADGTAHTESGVGLKHGVDVASIELWNYHSTNWGENISIETWTDDLGTTTGQRVAVLPRPTNLRYDNVDETSGRLDWDGVGPAWELLRSQSSGSDTSDYTTVATPQRTDSPPYTDTGLSENTDYYYRVTNASHPRLSNEVSFTTDAAVLIADDFEDGDYSDWSQQLDKWAVERTQYAKYGNYALNFRGFSASGGTAGKESYLFSGQDGLPGENDTITFNWTVHDNSKSYQFIFCKQNDGTEDNYNYVEVDGTDNELNIGTDEGPKYVDDRISGVSVAEDDILEVTVTHNGSYFTVDFPGFRQLDSRNRDESSVTYSSGGVGVEAGSGADGHIGRITYE